jgi:hypothetical protein
MGRSGQQQQQVQQGECSAFTAVAERGSLSMSQGTAPP